MASRVTDTQILEATVAAIRAHGVHGATTREIARAAGVNEVTLFRRFGDKQQLVRAAVHQVIAQLGPGDFQATDDVRADLLRIIRFYAAAFDPETGIALFLLAEATRHPEFADLLGEPVAVLKRVSEVLLHHQHRGTLIQEPVPGPLAALIGPLVIHATIRALGLDELDPKLTSSLSDEASHRMIDRFLVGHQAHTV